MTANVEQYKVITGMMIILRIWSARYKKVTTAGFRPIRIGEKIRFNNFNNSRMCGVSDLKHLLTVIIQTKMPSTHGEHRYTPYMKKKTIIKFQVYWPRKAQSFVQYKPRQVL